MGLLDEAIKQHLELKRLRGADPGEIARQEHEALDPPGVEPIGGLEVTPVADEAVAEPLPPPLAADRFDAPTVAPPPVSAEPLAPPPAPEPPAPEPVPAAYEPPPETPAPPPTHVDAVELPAEPHHEAQPVAEEPPSGDAFDMTPAPPVESATVHQPTAEYALEDLEALHAEPPPPAAPEPVAPEPPAPEPEPDDELSAAEADADVADEDVLEETPEFLQETPEHDRLWFEQKPPRDFDF
jgi:hypothetical protein